MDNSKQKNTALEIADLTFKLLTNCQEKEERLSKQLVLTISKFRTLRLFRGEPKMTLKHSVSTLILAVVV